MISIAALLLVHQQQTLGMQSCPLPRPWQALPAVEGSTGPAVGEGQGEDEEGKRKWRVGDLLADVRCSPVVLDSLPMEEKSFALILAIPPFFSLSRQQFGYPVHMLFDLSDLLASGLSTDYAKPWAA